MASTSSKKEAKLTESKEAQLKSYEKQVKDNIASMLDNFTEIIRQAKVTCVSLSGILYTIYSKYFSLYW